MAKKLLLNLLYTIGLVVAIILIFNGFSGKQYLYVALGVVIGAISLFLKVRLMKEVRNMQKKP